MRHESPPMRHCPCCGQSLAMRQMPEVDLDTNTLLYDTSAIHLTPSEAEILTVLLRQMPSVVSHERLRMGVYGTQDGPEDEHGCLTVFVCRLRQRLKPVGLKIVNHSGEGFNLTWATTDARAA